MHIFHIDLFTFPIVLLRRICLTIKSILSQESFPVFSSLLRVKLFSFTDNPSNVYFKRHHNDKDVNCINFFKHFSNHLTSESILEHV